VRDPRTGRGTVLADGEQERSRSPSPTHEESAELVRVGRLLERAAGVPQDGEFAVVDGDVLLLQCRPETVWSRKPPKAVAKGENVMAAMLATLTKKS